jgi:hypothetical protein
VTYASGGYYAYALAVADVNGDGKPDVIVANCAPSGSSTCFQAQVHGVVGVLLGNGDGTFRPVVTYDSGAYMATSVAVADVNGDGRLDLVIGHDDGTLGVLLGNGDGTFQPAAIFAPGWTYIGSVAIADVNGDGKPDVVVSFLCFSGGFYCDGHVGVLLGNGDGTFRVAGTYAAGGSYTEGPVAIADVNGDGKLDVLVTNLDTGNPLEGSVGVLLGNGDGTFQPTATYDSGGTYAESVAAADVNGDDKLDLVIANSGTDTLGVLLGNGDGTFQAARIFSSGGSYPHSVAVADVNGDGKADLVVTYYLGDGSGNNNLGVLLGNGDGTFAAAVSYFSGNFSIGAVVAVDLNGDGSPDVVVGGAAGTNNSALGSVGVLLNDSGPQNPTTTTLGSSPNPSSYGQAVTFTTTVTSGSGTPSGTVQLLYGSTIIGTGTLASGKVSIPIATLPTGSDSITASYLGGISFAPSKSAPLAQTVTKATSTTSLVSSLNPAATSQAVTFTATVTSQYHGAVSGTVSFMSGSQTLGSASLSGNVATLTTFFASVGTYFISARYNGDSNNTGSTSASLSEKVLASTTTTLTSSLNPSIVGQAVTFRATVSSSAGAPPNGETITFKNGSAALGTAPLSSGLASLTTSSLAAGIYTITASYPGDANFAASTSPALRQVVNSTTKSITQTTLVSSLNPSVYGQKVTWTATVTTSGSVPPTGKVNFTWGYNIGTVMLTNGVAVLTRSNLNADPYPLKAVYMGDTSNLASTSAVLNQLITQATTSAMLTSSPNPSSLGQAVTFTATITSPTVMPTGPVTFAVGKTVLGTAQLSGGKAKLTTSTLAVGSTKVTATYYGNSNIAKSSASVTQTVHE